MRNLLQETDR